MPTPVNRDDLRRLIIWDSAQLAEVLPVEEYASEHLPGALHLPLKRLTAASAEVLDRRRPVIVYCWDGL